jgi:GT2 family glycosyltransferase
MKDRYGEDQSVEIAVSVIIVNWDTKKLIQNCLDSVYRTMGNIAFEIIVVDNASSDGSLSLLEKKYPQVIKISNQKNKGFAAANNQAFAIMKGKYALLLNTDALLTPNAVNKLWTFCEQHQEAAIVCGQLLHADGSKQNSVAAFPSLLTLAINASLLEYLFPRRFPSKRYAKDGAFIMCRMPSFITCRDKASAIMSDQGLNFTAPVINLFANGTAGNIFIRLPL